MTNHLQALTAKVRNPKTYSKQKLNHGLKRLFRPLLKPHSFTACLWEFLAFVLSLLREQHSFICLKELLDCLYSMFRAVFHLQHLTESEQKVQPYTLQNTCFFYLLIIETVPVVSSHFEQIPLSPDAVECFGSCASAFLIHTLLFKVLLSFKIK